MRIRGKLRVLADGTVSGKCINRRYLTREERQISAQLANEAPTPLPATRADCIGGHRPCPLVRCEFNLYLTVEGESIKLNFPHLDVWEMKESCAADVMDRGGATLEETGDALNVSRERIRQIESKAIRKLGQHPEYREEMLERRKRPLTRPG